MNWSYHNNHVLISLYTQGGYSFLYVDGWKVFDPDPFLMVFLYITHAVLLFDKSYAENERPV